MKECFGFSLDQYMFYGGYPGAATLIGDEDRFSQYIQSAIIEATINKDILMDTPISKPALLRQTFELGASYSGEIVSLTKMVGALQDAGNTTTLAGYLNLLGDSGLLTRLQKFAIDQSRQRASASKLQVYNNALRTIYSNLSFRDAIRDHRTWGRIFESAVGAYILYSMLVLLCRSLFVRGTVRTVEIATVDGGVISVTRDAIAAQASHIVEADGSCSAARVRVDAKPRGHIRVHVRVLPHETVDVVAKGAELHEELMDGLAAVCGDKVEDVSLEFIEPESVKVASSDEDAEAGQAAGSAAEGRPTPDSTSEITVSMGLPRETPKEA